MILIIEDKKMLKFLRSQNPSIKSKYQKLKSELFTKPTDGEVYRLLSGERLIKLENDLDLDFEIHSCKFQDRLRLVYEYHKVKLDINGKIYDSWINITDLGNHTYKGQPYVTQFSE